MRKLNELSGDELDLDETTLNDLLATASEWGSNVASVEWGDSPENDGIVFLLLGDIAHSRVGALLTEIAKKHADLSPEDKRLELFGEMPVRHLFEWLKVENINWSFATLILKGEQVSLCAFRGKELCDRVRSKCASELGMKI